MLMLPKNLGAVALAAAGNGDVSRPGMTSVRVKEFQEDYYQITATDGKILAIVRGQSDGNMHPSLIRQGNDLFEYSVPAPAWKQAFAAMKDNKSRPADGQMGLAADNETKTVMLACGGREELIPLQLGIYPNVVTVMPNGPAKFAVKLNPALLSRLVSVLQSVMKSSGENAECWLLSWGIGKPIGLSGRTEEGQTIDCLIMPHYDKPAEVAKDNAENKNGEAENAHQVDAAATEAQPEPCEAAPAETASLPDHAEINGVAQKDLPGSIPDPPASKQDGKPRATWFKRGKK